LVNNPLYGDRNTLFRSYETRYVDYFGGDDDLDKITALGAADTVIDRIVRNCDFDKIYKFGDMNNDTAHARYMAVFQKNFNLKRTEYKDIVVSYIAYDPQTAAGVANMSVKVLEESYRHYYTSMKRGLSLAIERKVTMLDSAIASLTDTLSEMRDKYSFYSIISPGRQNVITGDIKGGGKGFGKAVEQIQNIESVKDQLVMDRAHYISVLDEFSASASETIDYLKMISRATPPTSPYGPGMQTTVVVCGFLGLFFSVTYILMITYFRKLNAMIRE
jgi:hypothetical protein